MGCRACQGSTWPGWQAAILKAGGWPDTPQNEGFFTTWQGQETGGSPAPDWNPFAVTNSGGGTPDFNSVGVMNFSSPREGAVQTAQRIAGYAAISAALSSGDPAAWSSSNPGRLQSDFQVWVTGHTGTVVYGGWDGGGNRSSGAGGGKTPRPRPGSAPPPGYENVLFGIPGTPSLPWLDIPSGVSSFFSGLFGDASSLTDIPGAIVSMAKTIALGIKFFLWFMDPKNWLRVIEVLFGAVLMLHGLYQFGKLFSKPGDTVPKTIFRGASAAATRRKPSKLKRAASFVEKEPIK